MHVDNLYIFIFGGKRMKTINITWPLSNAYKYQWDIELKFKWLKADIGPGEYKKIYWEGVK